MGMHHRQAVLVPHYQNALEPGQYLELLCRISLVLYFTPMADSSEACKVEQENQ